jgi:hypothetical protein
VTAVLFAQSSVGVPQKVWLDNVAYREWTWLPYSSGSSPACLSGLEQNDALASSPLVFRKVPGCACARYPRSHDNDVSLSGQFICRAMTE